MQRHERGDVVLCSHQAFVGDGGARRHGWVVGFYGEQEVEEGTSMLPTAWCALTRRGELSGHTSRVPGLR